MAMGASDSQRRLVLPEGLRGQATLLLALMCVGKLPWVSPGFMSVKQALQPGQRCTDHGKRKAPFLGWGGGQVCVCVLSRRNQEQSEEKNY